MTLKVSNYYRKTPKFWKRLGDSALVGIPLISSALMTAPLPEDIKLWLMFGCNILLAAFKIMTKFIGEEVIDDSTNKE